MKHERSFYIACFRDNVGPNVSFHRHQFAGYHTDIDQAYVCTFDEAQRHFNQAREFERPISADHVDALAVWKVDHQTLPNSTQIIDGVLVMLFSFKENIREMMSIG